MARFIPFVSLLLWSISLALPGIVYEPDLQDNPKHGFCANANDRDYACIFQKEKIYSCWRIDSDIKIPRAEAPASQDFIQEYCGNDWNTPLARKDYGYKILLMGWLGIFVFNFAWWGNILWLISIISFFLKHYNNAFYSSIFGIALGITALTLFRVPRNAGGVNDYVVDYLGVGYYIWMLALIVLGIFAYVQLKKEDSASLSLKKAILIFLTVSITLGVPVFLVSYSTKDKKLGMEAIVEELEKKSSEVTTNTRLLREYLEIIRKGNYKVMTSVSRVSNDLYYEKGVLVRVGNPVPNDPTKSYYIIKNGKIYIISAANKSFIELSVDSADGKDQLKKITALTVIDDFENNKQIYQGPGWRLEGSSQVFYDSNGSRIEIHFEKNTGLLKSLAILGSDSFQDINFIFEHEQLSEVEMNAAKQFPLDYQKIE